MEKELWKQIKGFSNYEVSNMGRVMSKQRKLIRKNPRWKTAANQEITICGRIINGWIKKGSYPTMKNKPIARLVALRKNNKTYESRIHHLVLDAFVGKRPSGCEGCHNDGNPLNNRVENLRWDTHKSNIHDAMMHKTHSKPPVFRGESHHNSTLSDSDVEKIRGTKYYHGIFAKLAREYKTSIQTISRIYHYKSRTK